MNSEARVIRLHYPKGVRWRSLMSLPDVAQAIVTLNDPTSSATIELKPETTDDRIEEIVHLFEAALDPGSGQIEVV